ncbi:miniconductance mechanosensitive channel MscM [Erwinia sp. OLTSP20]|uniref:miniconductance mechanosensitive channel MscM n=1 Tax=unclassified Erwinia TaxID=2622719 RepID=UPI000C1A2625|nr:MULTISPECIES: miniconductance mechanosensitive channel MscM [unclassified Erwinia]PIJ52081.1 miniconductance mechanosensitive channel MscM [Erwinia sp. OAMSP11]PIJ75244.1 miniconductance mechanosensitive channel MscM [Erwinia sp. OLSSP12]PIJ84451.1 miniconductance mechanosensitive channel MscM [Erwinia sp. OLCASP19]PIJ87065.1 miniconductance mechanosensitive channel MscM [Erwinia sp. OLMTSP26]PIJ88629.1 miniconductance mechanosensitive channel MscM [Erwinia sp. OLMDSP33]
MPRLLIALLFSWGLIQPALAAGELDAAQIKQQLEEAKSAKDSPTQTETIAALSTTLDYLNDRSTSLHRIRQYQQVIEDFPQQARELRQQISTFDQVPEHAMSTLSAAELQQEILRVNSQLMEERRLAQQNQDSAREIGNSRSQLPQQEFSARREVNEAVRRLHNVKQATSPLSQAQYEARQAAALAKKARVDEFELAQLSVNNRQELARLRAELHRKKYAQLDKYFLSLRQQLYNLRQREAEITLQRARQVAETHPALPAAITEQFNVNHQLSEALNQQAQRIEQLTKLQRTAVDNTQQVRKTLSTILEQSQWLSESDVLAEALRTQVERLPEMPNTLQNDNEITRYRVKRFYYEDMQARLPQLQQMQQENGDPLTAGQKQILDEQLKTQGELLTSLINGSDNLILEMTKLRVANGQLIDALNEVKEATHRYLFWAADIRSINLSTPLDTLHDLNRLLSLDTLGQLSGALVMMFTSRETLLPIIGALLLVGFSLSTRRHYRQFLNRAAQQIGNVTQDHFRLTVYTVFWSILVAVPLPVLWATLGFGLQHAWRYPIANAIGDGVTATLPLLWGVMISAAFARPNGLFIAHFRWSEKRAARAMRYYSLSIGFIVPLVMLLIAFDHLDDNDFSATLGRLCFILICGALSLVTVSLKRAGIPLYLDKDGSGDNLLNAVFWYLLVATPMVAAIAACLGYLATAQALLGRLETSVTIWFILLVIYYIIRRWMLIQRRRIAFDRARQRRADILSARAKGEEITLPPAEQDDEQVINLDIISAQSLRLVRSLLTLIALVSVIILWSEIYPAFGFLENIHLWDSSSTIHGVENIHPITLGSLLIAILVLIITTLLVRNMPALLELAVLQHLALSPGTGYAITTLSKYLLILIGGLMGFSLIGIDWSKLQWLVAAMGLGLGFGLQQIFANFISGLIILFEKPIRIGDTVTLRDLTGSVTRINTRATTITDWDRKEIIVPNQAFITEQFVNWSLSDSVTRIVLTIPASAEASTEQVVQVLLAAAARCSYVLETPKAEAWLVDLHQGIQRFELRVHAAEMGHRMPLRHELHRLILEGYREQGLEMPFPPFQARVETGPPQPAGSQADGRQKTFRSGGL